MTYSADFRSAILNYVDSHGHTIQHIDFASKIFGCSVRTIRAMIALRKTAGSSGEKISKLRLSRVKLSNVF